MHENELLGLRLAKNCVTFFEISLSPRARGRRVLAEQPGFAAAEGIL